MHPSLACPAALPILNPPRSLPLVAQRGGAPQSRLFRIPCVGQPGHPAKCTGRLRRCPPAMSLLIRDVKRHSRPVHAKQARRNDGESQLLGDRRALSGWAQVRPTCWVNRAELEMAQ